MATGLAGYRADRACVFFRSGGSLLPKGDSRKLMNQGHAKPYDAPVFRVAAESKLTDVRAFFDSYAVQVVVSGYVYLEAPIHTCQFETAEPVEIWDGALPVVDRSIDVHLVPWWP